MAVKTLTVTEKAYNLLRMLKYGDESFSDLILRIAEAKKGNVIKFYGALNLSYKEKEDRIKRIKKGRDEIDKEMSMRIKKIRARLR